MRPHLGPRKTLEFFKFSGGLGLTMSKAGRNLAFDHFE
jgi:hypothetical protein